jgi:hypothetical protein
MTVSSASNITDPFGGTNSTKIVAPTGSGLKLIGPATIPSVSSGTTVTASLYVKNAGGRYVIFYLNDSTSRMLRVDLQTGTITSNTADSGTIEALDDDWYRISFTRTLDTNLGGVLICPSLDGANVSFEGNGTDGLYIFGAQAEATFGATPSTYNKTSGEAYQSPRFDFDHQKNARGLLIEEARTNLFPYSQDFSQSDWNKSDSTIATSGETDPSGGTGAYKFAVANTSSNSKLLWDQSAVGSFSK